MRDFIDAFDFMGHNTGLLWHKTLEHLALSGAAIGIALALAIPLGAWLGHLHRGSFVAINVSNVGRALPPPGLRRVEAPLIGPSAYSTSSSTPRRRERMPAASGAGATH